MKLFYYRGLKVWRKVFGENKKNALTYAINCAVDECIEENVLKDILITQRMEGRNVVLTEFDQEKYDEMIREEGALRKVCELFSKKIITLPTALKESNLSESEFLEKVKGFGFVIE